MAKCTNLSIENDIQSFNKVYLLFEECIKINEPNLAEMLGVIHIYRIILEKAMLLLNNSLKLRGCCVKNPEEIIFESVNLGLISNKENWLEAVYSKEYYVHDEFSEDRVVSFYLQIKTKYFPIFNDLYLSKK